MKITYENDFTQRIDQYLTRKLEKSRNQIQNLKVVDQDFMLKNIHHLQKIGGMMNLEN